MDIHHENMYSITKSSVASQKNVLKTPILILTIESAALTRIKITDNGFYRRNLYFPTADFSLHLQYTNTHL
jgi:hypothetical protein